MRRYITDGTGQDGAGRGKTFVSILTRDGNGKFWEDTGREQDNAPSPAEGSVVPLFFPWDFPYVSRERYRGWIYLHSPDVLYPVFSDCEVSQTLASHAVSCPLVESRLSSPFLDFIYFFYSTIDLYNS